MPGYQMGHDGRPLRCRLAEPSADAYPYYMLQGVFLGAWWLFQGCYCRGFPFLERWWYEGTTSLRRRGDGASGRKEGL